MGSFEVVFNQPFGQFLIKDLRIGMEISKIDKLLLKRPVESFVVRIVFRGSNTAVVLRDAKRCTYLLEVLGKLCPVVMPHARNLSIKEIVQSLKEILAVLRALRLVHPREGHFPILVYGRKDGTLDAVPINDDCVETDDVSCFLLVPRKGVEVQFGDAMFCSLLS